MREGQERMNQGACCATCRYNRILEHNYVKDKGYEKSRCCTVLLDAHDEYGVIRQVFPRGLCKKYVKKDGYADYYNNGDS